MLEKGIIEKYGKNHQFLKIIKIVLTIAHLDHDETNWDVKDERLAALCQRCHLRYDKNEKTRRKNTKKYCKSLFPVQVAHGGGGKK